MNNQTGIKSDIQTNKGKCDWIFASGEKKTLFKVNNGTNQLLKTSVETCDNSHEYNKDRIKRINFKVIDNLAQVDTSSKSVAVLLKLPHTKSPILDSRYYQSFGYGIVELQL